MNQTIAAVPFHVRTIIAHAVGVDYSLLMLLLSLFGLIVAVAVFVVVLAAVLARKDNLSADKSSAAARSKFPLLRSSKGPNNATTESTE